MATTDTLQFREEASLYLSEQALPILREMTVARKLFAILPGLKVEDSIYRFFKRSSKDMSQFNWELVAPRFSQYATTPTDKPIGVIQEDLNYPRHEYKRGLRDILNIDERKRDSLTTLNEKEERIAIFGDATTGVTSFSGVGTNTTDMTTSLDMTTFVTYTATFETMVTEAKVDLKAREFNKAEKHMLWVPDVDARARGAFSTVDDTKSIYIWTAMRMAQLNNVPLSQGVNFIHESGYLGSATGAGTANACFICKHIDSFALAAAPLEVAIAVHEINGVQIQYALRTTPVFKRIEACHYDSAVDIIA